MGETRGKKVWARRPFGYAGQVLAQGEIFELGGYANDELLLRFRYVEEIPKFKKFHEHGPTGRRFIEAGWLAQFGRAHERAAQERVLYAQEGYGFVDTTGDAEQRRLDSEVPLDLSQAEGTP